ncbi:MAG: PatB family C-S lyase [Ignavibacteria bacterium]|nr:PatB family C-S lyase [Ignavibacteria bacterium]
MIYNFDNQIDREGTSSVKFDLRAFFFKTEDLLPMWVADMDFETPEFIRDAVIERAKHPIYGYTFKDDTYYQHIIDWFQRRHQWEISKDSIIFSPGVVPALNLAMLAYTKPNDKVIVQSPVYFPFFTAISDHGRQMVNNQLIKGETQYEIDFDLLEKQAEDAVMLILCNPHNPVGRAWKRWELERIASICIKNNVIVLSDEIHCDLVLPGYKHQVFADLSPDAAEITITAHAPSKTFNLAGLGTSSVIITNPELRKKFKDIIQHLHLEMGNLFGITASNAAFSAGDEWLEQLLNYINQNVDDTVDFFEKNLPRIKVFRPEATYMIWLDFSAYGLSDNELKNKMIDEAKLGLSQGIQFGAGGESCMRLNVACPNATLQEALAKMHKVFA